MVVYLVRSIVSGTNVVASIPFVSAVIATII